MTQTDFIFQKLTDNCDPVYEETFEYKGPLSESQLRTLEVLVVSKKTFARNPVLGMVSWWIVFTCTVEDLSVV